MKELLDKVREFQIASEQPVNDSPSIADMTNNFLRYTLMKEENKEYATGCQSNDLVEVLDACADQLYVLLGTINQHGLQDVIGEAFERVHINNMSKLIDGKIRRNPDGKILKPIGFVKVELNDLITLN